METPEELKVLMREWSKKGGLARAKALLPDRRIEIARKAGSAPKRPRKPKSP